MGRIIKAETDEQKQIYRDMGAYGFAPSPTRASADDPPELPTDYLKTSSRYLYYEGDVAVSSLHSIPMTQNVRGTVFSMQGIAGVTTYPEHRYKGYVKELMHHSLFEGKKAGQVFTTLYPFRESFYGNFGYTVFPQSREAIISPSRLQNIRKIELKGKFTRSLLGESTKRYHEFLKIYQAHNHGTALFADSLYESAEKEKRWVAFAEYEGKDRAMIVYETKGFEKEMKIVEFLYLDDIGKYMILQYLYTHKDQFSEIHLRLMDRDQPELWVLDTKLRIKNRDWVPSPMGRILDVSGMSGMEVGEGTVKINVTDSHCDWNTGSWELVSENGKLHVNPIPSGEIDMTISGLSALVYGVYEIGDLQVKGELSQTDQSYQLSSLFPKLSTSLFSLF